MNKFIVYTTEGHTTGPNINADVENCQVLGIIEGNSDNDAIKKLFNQNEWIVNAGFTLDNALALPLLTDTMVEDIRTVTEYLWEDELNHFQENHSPKNHVFRILKRLKDKYICTDI